MLQHIALTVNNLEEIEGFYENVLLFSIKHKFSIDKELSWQIFNINKQTDVYIMTHDGTQLEIFLSPEKEKKAYSHICLAYLQSKVIYEKAVELGYKTLVKKNPVNDTYFIWDKSGNIFEIKEMQKQTS